jgi:Xaa-Pro aminopeptidase
MRVRMCELGLDRAVVTKRENVRYLSGFTGDSGVAVVSGEESVLVTDGRYSEQVAMESPGWEAAIHTGGMVEEIAARLEGGGRVGFETTITYRLRRDLGEALESGTELVPTEDLVDLLRTIKEPVEIDAIREAIRCAAFALGEILPLVKPGSTERRIAAELDYRMMLEGAEGPSFDTIVASGPNSSRPHAGVTDRTLEEGDLVVLDFGARSGGYNSDNTRTVLLKEGGRERGLLDAVKGALEAALAVLEPGSRAADADLAARSHLEGLGLAGYFNHGLGHGVGLETHEKPTLSHRSGDVLEPGMVFTVEPGVYIEGLGGARLEEMVLITDDGYEVLSGGVPFP